MNKKQSKVIEYNPNEWKANSELVKYVKPKITYKPDDWKTNDELVRSTYPRIKFIDEIINGYQHHNMCLGPYHIFLTLVFSKPVDDKLAMRSISYLFKSVQRKLFNRNEVMNNKCFTGVSVAERHKISIEKENCFHFHNLIKIDSSKWNDKSINEIESVFKNKCKSLTNYRLGYDYKIANDDNAIDMKAAYSTDAEDYCIKELDKVSTGIDTQIGYINSTGVHDFSSITDNKLF
jgi:hypothetical protein